MTNWKEKYNQLGYDLVGEDGFNDFIETEIIEKLIEDIPDYIVFGTLGVRDATAEVRLDDVKQEIKAKWLGNSYCHHKNESGEEVLITKVMPSGKMVEACGYCGTIRKADDYAN